MQVRGQIHNQLLPPITTCLLCPWDWEWALWYELQFVFYIKQPRRQWKRVFLCPPPAPKLEKKSLSLFQSLCQACYWLKYSKSLKTSVQRSRGRLDHMPSLPPHIHSTTVYTIEVRRAKNRTAASCKVFLLVRVCVCVVILYNTHRPHCIFCVPLLEEPKVLSLVTSTFWYMCVTHYVVISHSRQATL